MENITIQSIVEFITQIEWSTWTIGGVVTAVVLAVASTGVFSFLRRPKKYSSPQGEAKYFTDSKLLSQPMPRPAYSDRMAYVMAEMSALAYYEFEGYGSVLKDAAKHLLNKTFDNEEDIERILNMFANDLLIKGVDSREFFSEILKTSGFDLIDTICVAETQAFACKRNVPNEPPYIVIAFRGTEQKISDWLTDAKAAPKQEGVTKVHTGFHEALMKETDDTGKTALQRVKDILEGQEAKDGNGKALPIFITGHSLGGALALLTTKQIASNINGACYTFGGPRVANYEYFDGIKTPVFRIVNSSDIVPRVPPGALITVIVRLIQGFSWLTNVMPPISRLLNKLEGFLDKLNGYRHYGDLRYLTDVKGGRFNDVKLLTNPPAIDRVMWMWQSLAASFFMPLKSHGMIIYRRKLDHIANSRNMTT